jgi:hypothetical protein
LKSRARINRRCGDEDVLLHLFFKHHKRRPKVTPSLRRRSRDRKIFGLMLDCPLCYSTLDFPFIRSQ